jgi:hypothetical protein
MVIHGKNDPESPSGRPSRSWRGCARTAAWSSTCSTRTRGHGLAKLKNRLDAYPKIAAFLDEHLSPAERVS